jgi:hypothetical protein
MATELKDINARIKKDGFIKGVFLGLIVLVLSIFSFYFILANATSPILVLAIPFFCSYIIPLIISVFFILDIRKKASGYLTFKQVVTGAFIMFFVNFAILTIGRDLVFVKVFEPDMIKQTEAAMITSSRVSYKQQKFPRAETDSRIAELKKGFDDENNMTAFETFSGYLTTIILLFVLAVIFAAAFKKDPPILLETDIV